MKDMGARTRTTLPLESPGCVGRQARDIELALRRVPGVRRAHVNQATEMVYAEYDRAQCDERFLRQTIAYVASTDRANAGQATTGQARTDTVSRCVTPRGATTVDDGIRGAGKRSAWKSQAAWLAPLVGMGIAATMGVVGASAVCLLTT